MQNIVNEYLKLNDLLGLDEKEISNSKIVLNMTSQGRECLDIWLNDDNYVGFSYWSHQGEWKSSDQKKPNKNLHVGNIVYGFVRLGDDRWLLVTVGKITVVPEISLEHPSGGHCSYEMVQKYIPLFGRLIIKLKKVIHFRDMLLTCRHLLKKVMLKK